MRFFVGPVIAAATVLFVQGDDVPGVVVRDAGKCQCNAECVAFGDPHLVSFDRVEKIVECLNGTSITLLDGYGMRIVGTCAGSKRDITKGWLRILHIKDSDGSEISRDAYACEELEASNPALKRSKSWQRQLETFTLSSPSFKKDVRVTLSCAKRQGKISMEGTYGVQNTVFAVHLSYTDKTVSDYTSASGFLMETDRNGVSGFCVPQGTDGDASSYAITSLSVRAKKNFCANVAMPYGQDCNMETLCDDSDCQKCVDDTTPDSKCTYCIPPSEAADIPCKSDDHCCSLNCVKDNDSDATGTCEGIDQTNPTACCNPDKSCYPNQNTSDVVNDGTCSECVTYNNICDASTACCDGLTCNNGFCTSELPETCSCEAKCAGVADPVVKTFAYYSANHYGAVNTMYKDDAFGTSGLQIDYKSSVNAKNDRLWITAVVVNGDQVVSLDDCPAYTAADLPPCTKSNCKNKRDKLEDLVLTKSSAKNLMVNGIFPFTATNDVRVEVHCVSKRRINSGWPNRRYTRLDVYLNKKSTFIKTVDTASPQNIFMAHELSAGNTGLCLEPFSSNPDALQTSEDQVAGWKKLPSDKISTDDCSCGPLDTN